MESIYQINYRSNSSQVVNGGGLLLDLRHVHLEWYGLRWPVVYLGWVYVTLPLKLRSFVSLKTIEDISISNAANLFINHTHS